LNNTVETSVTKSTKQKEKIYGIFYSRKFMQEEYPGIFARVHVACCILTSLLRVQQCTSTV